MKYKNFSWNIFALRKQLLFLSDPDYLCHVKLSSFHKHSWFFSSYLFFFWEIIMQLQSFHNFFFILRLNHIIYLSQFKKDNTAADEKSLWFVIIKWHCINSYFIISLMTKTCKINIFLHNNDKKIKIHLFNFSSRYMMFCFSFDCSIVIKIITF